MRKGGFGAAWKSSRENKGLAGTKPSAMAFRLGSGFRLGAPGGCSGAEESSMGLYLVFATGDLRAKVRAVCPAFYMPFRHGAIVAYPGQVEELARRLGLGPHGGPGVAAGVVHRRLAGVVTAVLVALLVSGVLT
jgi:hypothetical protein